jgi:SAM-dependent methyltransferase
VKGFAGEAPALQLTLQMNGDFARFEHAGWQRVADKYDSAWSSLRRQFIPHLISAARVSAGMSVLNVACGPGYVSAALKELDAVPTGTDFSEKMIAIAKGMLPDISFIQGDAQQLPFADVSFDRVLINFGLLHVSYPERACAEACRVLKSNGRLGFSVWAGPEKNPGAKIVNDAIEAHADLDVGLPEGPPHYLRQGRGSRFYSFQATSNSRRKFVSAIRVERRTRYVIHWDGMCSTRTLSNRKSFVLILKRLSRWRTGFRFAH